MAERVEPELFAESLDGHIGVGRAGLGVSRAGGDGVEFGQPVDSDATNASSDKSRSTTIFTPSPAASARCQAAASRGAPAPPPRKQQKAGGADRVARPRQQHGVAQRRLVLGAPRLELWRKVGDDGLKKAAYRGG